MGNATSTAVTSNENNQTFISETTVDMLNKSVNESIASSLIKSNSNCTSVTDVGQKIAATDCVIGGDLNITGVKMDSVVTVNFDCVNAVDAQNDMAQEMMSGLMSEIASGADIDSKNAMDTNAETAAKTSGVFGGDSDASTITNNKYDLKTINSSHSNIENVIMNSIDTNFDVENVQKCVSEMKTRQDIDVSGCNVGGNFNVSDIDMNSSIENTSKCMNEMKVAQEVINAAMNDLGVVVVADTAVKTDSVTKTKTKTTAISEGITLPQCASSGGFLLFLCFCSALLIVSAIVVYSDEDE